MKLQSFASDNSSGICPEALNALIEANQGHVPSYGEDRWTREVCDLFRDLFEAPCEVFFVFNGTAGNSISLAALCRSYHSIICHRLAHLETDECGAPEFFSHGSKILTAGGDNGRLDPAEVERLVLRRNDMHYPKPRVVAVTQATEVGSVYQPEHLQPLQQVAAKHHLKFHMDGARFANAIAFLDLAPRSVTVDVGVDVLCLGGSKNGLAVGEALIFFNPEDAEEFAYRCKQAGQLASKMRFIAAQWLGLLKNGAWLRYARHANACAQLLNAQLQQIPEVEVLFPSQANSVFVRIAPPITKALYAKGWAFYDFIGAGGSRLMCSWDTQEATIHAFIDDLKTEISRSR